MLRLAHAVWTEPQQGTVGMPFLSAGAHVDSETPTCAGRKEQTAPFTTGCGPFMYHFGIIIGYEIGYMAQVVRLIWSSACALFQTEVQCRPIRASALGSASSRRLARSVAKPCPLSI